MSTYAIGDVQGCYDELQALLQLIHFQPSQDQLWFVGDLINRGPKSLETLRFIKSLPNKIAVLGNHDLYLIVLAAGHTYSHHSLHTILTAPDRDELIHWLRHQPLLHYDATLNYVMTHAGIPPQWNLQAVQQYAHEVEQALQTDNYAYWIRHLFDKQINRWHGQLNKNDRLCYIVNAFTRMRFCTAEGILDLKNKGELMTAAPGYLPWFKIPNRATNHVPLIFGHWAALRGQVDVPNVYALDTGCVWGEKLCAMRLEDRQLFHVDSFKKK